MLSCLQAVDWRLMQSMHIFTQTIMHVVYTPKFCITIVFDFAWDDCNTQEKRWLCKIFGVKQSALWGVFHSTKTSGLNFRQLPVANVTTFSKISKKKNEEPRQVYPNFRKCFPESFLSIQVFSRNFKNFCLNGSHFANSTVSKTSPGNFCSIYCCFQIFESFG